MNTNERRRRGILFHRPHDVTPAAFDVHGSVVCSTIITPQGKRISMPDLTACSVNTPIHRGVPTASTLPENRFSGCSQERKPLKRFRGEREHVLNTPMNRGVGSTSRSRPQINLVDAFALHHTPSGLKNRRMRHMSYSDQLTSIQACEILI